jgi:TRAP-type C4-dicarboxylate transport system permease small subunit
LTASSISQEDRKTWTYAFAILLLVSIWMLFMRFFNNPFLAEDFEVTVVYLPTVVAGIIAAYITLRSRKTTQ